jgi:hypothetical protein
MVDGREALAPKGRVPYQPYGSGIYRREVRVEARPGCATGELVDDFHHFRARIWHDGARVLEVRGEALRHPWTTCAGAAQPLRRLIGIRLAASPRAAAAHTQARAQCTHLFDAASLAIARAARGGGGRVYRIAVPDRVEGRTRATLERDGSPLLAWELAGPGIVAPEPFAGRALRGSGFADWAEGALEPELAEAALVLQRACAIAAGRAMDLEGIPRAADVPLAPLGACHTYAPGVVERALRVVGSARNLSCASDLRAASLGGPLAHGDQSSGKKS